jgi:hypothetical protein
VECVHEFVTRRGRFSEDPQPAEGIHPLIDREHARRNRRPADAVKSIAAGDDIALQFVIDIAMTETDDRAR